MDSLRSTRLFVCTTLFVVILLGIVAAGGLPLQAAHADEGDTLLQDEESLLEIKVPNAIPLWLVRVLSEAGIRQCSFSKYGSAYLAMLNNYRMRGVSLA